MYLQITTQCNMSCAHCLFSCAQGKKGEFMSRETFKKALRLAEEFSAYLTLGGGEPTLHPKFWEFFGLAMAAEVEGVWMATNGSVTKTALALARIAKGSDFFGVALSQDEYHDPIDQEVISAFYKMDLEIRNVSDRIINQGSALENGIGELDECGCGDMHIKPDGSIYMCGCTDSLKLGHIDHLDYEMLNRAQEIASLGDGCGRKLTEQQKAYIAGLVEDPHEEPEEFAKAA